MKSLYICGNSSSIKDGMEINKINNFIVRYGSKMGVNMIGRMKREISTLNNKKNGKEITQYTIATVIIWIYVWIMNIVKDNDVVGKLVLVIMSFIVLCGCIAAFKARKNKMILIFFKVISLWMMSLAFLSMAYTSYYAFLKFKNIYFVYLTIFIYILIFLSTLRIVIIRAKTEMKIKKEIMNKNKTVLIGSTIFLGIGYFIIEPIVKKYGQFTMLVTIICSCLLICYILVACSTYYLVEYMVSKQLNNK
ncbi:hypothetical protein OD350_19125 [Clostridium beijerinckii]|uniref:hypothetical protein n=1 Tax=Clostridium beijerinckii TaxID=1520 RepID=UPI00156DADD4|nr:hypothetical protein [Clostridium beijerinckii]NRT37125.1 small-conductance mechanosensitive channel [Clostridium beijerinckii]NRT43441.1 small-conductance mechanosensitive channel [Clostridium beijerinckii]UYZ34361.1 hypothetical protein OD350_19125 [Clostridium beijerinckii]